MIPVESPSAENSVTHIVTMVHGTWARGFLLAHGTADWTTLNSPICKAVEGALGENVRIGHFNWSGWNTISARLRAAAGLKKLVLNQRAQFPKAKQVLVAHSHGGNVAMYALRDEAFRNAVSGTVCLATPFLHARHRNLGPFIGLHGFALPICIVIAVFSLLEFRFSAQLEQLLGKPNSINTTVIFLAVAATILTPLLLLATFWNRLSRSLLQRMALPLLHGARLQIIRAGGDEATGGLTAAQFFGWALTRVWCRYSVAVGRFQAYTSRLGGSWFMRASGLSLLAFGLVLFSLAVAARVMRQRDPLPLARWMALAIGLALLIDGIRSGWLRRIPAWLRDLASRSHKPLWLVRSLLAISLGIAVFLLAWGPEWLPEALAVVPGFMAVGITLLAMLGIALTGSAGLLLVGLAVPLAVLLVPFGPELAMANLFLEVTAEATPPGVWTVHQLPQLPPLPQPAAGARRSLMGLMHSSVHGDPRTAKIVADWIKAL